jgi:hypothetical protein
LISRGSAIYNIGMKRFSRKKVISSLVLAAAGLVLLIMNVSLRPENQAVVINPQLLNLSEQFQLTGEIHVTQHWPAFLWPGQRGQVKLTIEYFGDPSELTAPGLAWQARLELPHFNLNPGITITQTLQPGRVQNMIWTIDSSQRGVVAGTLWLNLVRPGASDGVVNELILSSPIQVQVPFQAFLPWQVFNILVWAWLAVALLSWILVMRDAL